MTMFALDPYHRALSSEIQASIASSPAAVRTLILSAWSNGPGTVLLSGAAGTGKTALLEQLAWSFAGTGRLVQLFRRGDEVVLPDGAVVLLVDEADRMSDALLRRLLTHPRLFCVLAARPPGAQRIQSTGVTIPVVQLGGSLATHPPRRPLLPLRRRPSATVAAALGAVLLFASAALLWRLLPRPSERATASLPHEAAGSPSVPAASPVPAPTASTSGSGPTDDSTGAPTEAREAARMLRDGQPTSGGSAVAFAIIPSAPPSREIPALTDLPSAAIPTINVSYGKETSTALRAAITVERLRKAGIATGDPVPSPRQEKSSIRVYFPADRDIADGVRSRAGDIVAGISVELAPPGPSTRPGQIDILLGDGGGPNPPDYDTVLRGRRVSGPDLR